MTFNYFNVISDLKLNIKKCEGLWLGSPKEGPESVYGIEFKGESLRLLAIYLRLNNMCFKKLENKIGKI